jgi:ankyrin repeat protein
LGETPLHYAVVAQKIDLLKLLILETNIELSANKKGDTPFEYATKIRVEEAINILNPLHTAGSKKTTFRI